MAIPCGCARSSRTPSRRPTSSSCRTTPAGSTCTRPTGISACAPGTPSWSRGSPPPGASRPSWSSPASCRWDAAACPRRGPRPLRAWPPGPTTVGASRSRGSSVRFGAGRREPRSAWSPRAAGCWSSCPTARGGAPRSPSPTPACGCEACAGRVSTGTGSSWRVAVFVGEPDDLEVEEPPSPSPFDQPARPVRDVLREGHEPERGRLVRVNGVVLHHRPGQPLYLRDATGTVVVETDQREPLAPGDLVDVVGFPATGGSGPRIEDASYRLAGHGLPPAPVAVEAGQVVGGTLTAELVRLEAPLLSSVQGETGTTLLLQLGHGVLEARGDGDLPAGLSLEPGSLLAAQGILLAHRDEGAEPILRLLVRSPADVALIRRPPWWTPARAAWAVGGLVAGLLVAFVWLSTLHRQVRSQTAVVRESEERYRLLAENASDVIVTLDPQLHCTYASPSAARQTGYSVEELLRMPLDQLLTPDSFAVALSTLRAVAPEVEKAAPTGALTLELETIGKDRSRRWYEVRLSLLRERGGPVQGFLAVARDVTSRYHTQRELARLATAVDQAAEAVVLTDLEGAILYVNPAFERITGYAAAEAMGQNPRLLKSGLHDPAFYAELWSVVRSGKTWEGRFTNRRKDGVDLPRGREHLADPGARERAPHRLRGAQARRDPTGPAREPPRADPEDGGCRPARRRRRPRLQQHARRHPRPGRRRRAQGGTGPGSPPAADRHPGCGPPSRGAHPTDPHLQPPVAHGASTRRAGTRRQGGGPPHAESPAGEGRGPREPRVQERRGGRSDPDPPGRAEPRDERRPRDAGQGRCARHRPHRGRARRGLRGRPPAHSPGPLPLPHRARRRRRDDPGRARAGVRAVLHDPSPGRGHRHGPRRRPRDRAPSRRHRHRGERAGPGLDVQRLPPGRRRAVDPRRRRRAVPSPGAGAHPPGGRRRGGGDGRRADAGGARVHRLRLHPSDTRH